MDSQGTILSLTVECQGRFNTLILTLEATDVATPISPSDAQTELGRFRLWANNIGAAKMGRAGLDYRLCEAPYMFENILALLNALKRTLNDGIVITGTLPNSKLQT